MHQGSKFPWAKKKEARKTAAGFVRTNTGFGESIFMDSEPEPRTQGGAEAASIKGFAGQVWALHMALWGPVWDLCKTFLPRNFRA